MRREMKWWKEESVKREREGGTKITVGGKGECLRRARTEGNAMWRMWMSVCWSGEKLRGGETGREWNEKSVHGGQREGWEMSWSKKHCKHFFASLESTWIWKEFSPRGNSYSETGFFFWALFTTTLCLFRALCKALVHLKRKILSLFIHYHVIFEEYPGHKSI